MFKEEARKRKSETSNSPRRTTLTASPTIKASVFAFDSNRSMSMCSDGQRTLTDLSTASGTSGFLIGLALASFLGTVSGDDLGFFLKEEEDGE